MSATNKVHSSPKSAKAGSRRGIVLAAVLPLLLTGCYDYRARSDAITMQLGDAAASNQVVHMRDPWPLAARDTEIETDGKRAQLAFKRYQANESLEPRLMKAKPMEAAEPSDMPAAAGK